MGLQFGMSAVQSGKRVMQTSNEPTLTANSTKAKFTLAAAVTRIMGLIPGDNVQFVSNIADIDAAIAERDADVMAWCEENNVEFGTEAARSALIQTFGEYGICKGVPLFEKNGEVKLAGVRMTAEQKAAAFELNKEKIAAELGKSVEEITIDDYNPTTRAYSGARTSTSSNLNGLGLPLNFSDSAMWAELKENLGDEAEKFNRIFEVNLNEPFVVAVETGKVIGDEKETVEVNAYKISFKADEEPAVRQSSK
jgi:hypothetical protein